MSKEIPFDSIVVGETLGPIEYMGKNGDRPRFKMRKRDLSPIIDYFK